MAKSYRIAVIAGDGIGHEVMPQGIAAMEAAAHAYGFGFAWNDFDWSCERYRRTGRMMPEDALERLRLYDAVYLGAVGHPDVPDHISLWGLLIPLRRSFHQYVNLRPEVGDLGPQLGDLGRRLGPQLGDLGRRLGPQLGDLGCCFYPQTDQFRFGRQLWQLGAKETPHLIDARG